jgi:galactokinase
MDQYAVRCSEPGSALLLDCARVESRAVALPDGIEILIFDTGVERALREGRYAARRAECTRALEGARSALGRRLDSLSELALADLARIERVLDPIALRRARHVVGENARVLALAGAFEVGDLRAAGEAMFASHQSLRVDYEVTVLESDALVEDSRSLPGGIGARMTGAGFGGCTVHLVEAGHARAFATELARRFLARFGRTPRHWTSRAAAGANLI